MQLPRLVASAARVVGSLAALSCLVFFGGGCDQGSPSDQSTRGPFLHVVSANVGPSKALPADGAVLIAFDRPLLPSTVNRQSVVLREGDGTPVNVPIITYDPVAKTVAIANPNPGGGAWLSVGQPYRVQLVRAKLDSDGGLRAVDRAPVDPAENTVLAFYASAPTHVVAPTVSYCDDVLPLLQSRCSGSACHSSNPQPSGASAAAAGLILDTPLGLRSTALDRVARGANTGSRDVPRAAGPVFGVDMPLVDPGSPGTSWLLYKALLADFADVTQPPAFRASCDGTAPAAVPDFAPSVAAPWSATDRASIGQYVTGQSMPYPTFTAAGTPLRDATLSYGELQRLRAWIAQGADAPDCSACVATTTGAASAR